MQEPNGSYRSEFFARQRQERRPGAEQRQDPHDVALGRDTCRPLCQNSRGPGRVHWKVLLTGFLGFVAFELLRLYKLRREGAVLIPDGRVAEHVAIVGTAAIVVALIAGLTMTDPRLSAWVCFSAPTSASALFGHPTRSEELSEDSAHPGRIGQWKRAGRFLNDHFRVEA